MSEEQKHTPGPWVNKDGMIYGENDPVGATIVIGNCRTSDADLQLIAAAPDLLEISQEMLGLLKILDDCSFIGENDEANWQKWETAITKAKEGK